MLDMGLRQGRALIRDGALHQHHKDHRPNGAITTEVPHNNKDTAPMVSYLLLSSNNPSSVVVVDLLPSFQLMDIDSQKKIELS